MINEKISNTHWENQPIFKVKEISHGNDCKSLVVNNENSSVIRKIIAKLKKFFIKYTKGKR